MIGFRLQIVSGGDFFVESGCAIVRDDGCCFGVSVAGSDFEARTCD